MEKKREVKKLKGIGGWLILPTIFFFIIAIAGIGVLISGILISEINFTTISIGLLSFLFIYILYLEFKHKKEFPKYAIIGNWCFFIILSIIVVLDSISIKNFNYSNFVFSLFLNSIMPIIWTTYFLKSKRIKNTFVK
jgi:hypothetical protein